MEIDLMQYAKDAIDAIIKFAPSLGGAIASLFIGMWLSKKVSGLTAAGLRKANFAPEISSFLVSLIDISLKVFVILFSASILGFDTTALVGILAAAGFAVGLALQGGLSNFAAGIMILVFKPYKVNDWIEVDEKFGKVEEIQIFNTIMVTPGRKSLIIPNSQITENIITNFSRKDSIRIELNVTMPYEESFPKVREVILEVLRQTPGVLQEPLAEVGIETYDSHNIVIAVRPFINPNDYWEVTYDVYGRIKAAFNRNDIRVAYSEGVEIGKIGE